MRIAFAILAVAVSGHAAQTVTNVVYITNYNECIIETTPPTPDMGNRIGIRTVGLNNFASTPLRSITFHGTNFSDYFLFKQGYITNFSFPELVSQVTDIPPSAELISFGIQLCTNAASISAPLFSVTRALDISQNAALTNVDFSAMKYCWTLNANSNTALATLSLPALTNTLVSLTANSCTALTNVSVPVWLPTNTCTILLSNCAFTATAVNHVLARCVANAGFVSGTVLLNGGTSAAPSGQGATDKSTLISRGVTVVTN